MKLRLAVFGGRKALRLGWPGALGAAGLAVCLGLYFSQVQPAEQRRDVTRARAASLEQRLGRGAAGAPNAVRPVEEQLAAFYRLFPSENEAADWVGKIAAIAQRDGLALQQADYKAQRDKSGKLVRYQVSLPLKGEYKTIRKFLSEVRTELPVVSLEQVQFERQKVGDAVVDAKVRLVIFLGASS